MDIILFEIYRFLFICSIIYISYNIGDVAIKTFARFKLNVETKLVFNNNSKIMLWASIGVIITYLTRTFTI